MTGDAGQLAVVASWGATGLGFGLWLWSWLGENNPIQKLRFRDAGMVLIFASILVRILTQTREMTIWDWGLAVLSPVFIGAALWRLTRTGKAGRP